MTAALGRQSPEPIAIEKRTTLDLLVQEATRQLDICNACRYCEGLCAVFPALERRTLLEQGDISQLANLCHDCRACYDGCMYAHPHEFDLDVPKVLSAVRVADYDRYVWPPQPPKILSGWSGVILSGLLSVTIMLVAAVSNVGWSGLVYSNAAVARSPYQVIPYWALLLIMIAAGLYAVAVSAFAARKYWREVGGAAGRVSPGPIAKAVWYAATLRYLRGGGADCYYPQDDKPSPKRRALHAMVAHGFGLCLVSTVAAGIEQDLLKIEPPYPWFSVPVISGVVGGIGLVLGCIGLLILKARSSKVTGFAEMTIKDYGLLSALAFLGVSGMATLLVRDTPAFGIVLLIHLAAVAESFALAPYSKFVHVVFRFAALVRDNLEIAEEKRRAPLRDS